MRRYLLLRHLSENTNEVFGDTLLFTSIVAFLDVITSLFIACVSDSYLFILIIFLWTFSMLMPLLRAISVCENVQCAVSRLHGPRNHIPQEIAWIPAKKGLRNCVPHCSTAHRVKSIFFHKESTVLSLQFFRSFFFSLQIVETKKLTNEIKLNPEYASFNIQEEVSIFFNQFIPIHFEYLTSQVREWDVQLRQLPLIFTASNCFNLDKTLCQTVSFFFKLYF